MKNKIWIPYFTLGVFSLIVFGFSCKKRIEYSIQCSFYFKNETSQFVTFDYQPFNSHGPRTGKYNIAPNKTTEIIQIQDSDKSLSINQINAPFLLEYGFQAPLEVRFDAKKCWNVDANTVHSPLDIKNYVTEKSGNGKGKYISTYTFTEDDYNRAVICH